MTTYPDTLRSQNLDVSRSVQPHHRQKNGLHYFYIFAVRVYPQAWNTPPQTVIAPGNDFWSSRLTIQPFRQLSGDVHQISSPIACGSYQSHLFSWLFWEPGQFFNKEAGGLREESYSIPYKASYCVPQIFQKEETGKCGHPEVCCIVWTYGTSIWISSSRSRYVGGTRRLQDKQFVQWKSWMTMVNEHSVFMN